MNYDVGTEALPTPIITLLLLLLLLLLLHYLVKCKLSKIITYIVQKLPC